MPQPSSAKPAPPAVLAEALAAKLHASEQFIAWLECDLDANLRYRNSYLVLTSSRILAGSADAWQSWELNKLSAVHLRTHGTFGKLELVTNAGATVAFPFTIGKASAARRWHTQWECLAAPAKEPVAVSVCPSCGTQIPGNAGRCPACTPAAVNRPHASLLRLLPFAKNRRWMILLGFVLTVSGSAATMVSTYLIKPLTDRVLVPAQSGQEIPQRLVYAYLGGMAGFILVSWLLSMARYYVMSWVSERISADLRTRTFNHLLKLSQEFFGGKRTGDLMSRISSDTDRICNFLSLNLVTFGDDVIMFLMTAVILLSIDFWLALVTLLPFPLIAWLVYRARRRLRSGYARAYVAWAEMTSVLADTIPGIRVVKAFAQERREAARFQQSNARILQLNDRTNQLWAFFTATVELLTAVGGLIVWAFGVYQVAQGRVSVGTLWMFLAYISRFYTKLESLSWIATATQRAAAASHRLFEILDRVPSVQDPVKPVQPGKLRGKIEIKKVCFQYGSRRVLHDVELTIQPGEMIGLVGHSGAGKSTLVNLICRFYDATEGAILVDGVDIRSYPVEAYRKCIGIVLQDPFLFYGTIADNIAYGRPDATREEIIAAAKAARAHEFILRLPDGYDSIVGERGQLLSGGERQRISIARALLIDPAILILDEATSSVDTETEREIQAALENLIRGRTTVAIAHRLSTLRRANRVVVLDQGRIVEMGPHDELLAAGGAYARLHKAQFDAAPGSPSESPPESAPPPELDLERVALG